MSNIGVGIDVPIQLSSRKNLVQTKYKKSEAIIQKFKVLESEMASSKWKENYNNHLKIIKIKKLEYNHYKYWHLIIMWL